MPADLHGERIPLRVSRGCVVASVPTDLTSEVLTRLRADCLESIRASSAGGLILDLSAVDLMDAADFAALRATLGMARLLGARPVLVGLRPGVIVALMDLDVDVDGLLGVQTLDDAFALLETGA